MAESLHILDALFLGMGLGVIYFGGLWLTVRRLFSSPRPAFMTLGSYYARASIALVGFYLVMDGRLDRLLVAVAGFLLIRILCVRMLSPAGANSPGQ